MRGLKLAHLGDIPRVKTFRARLVVRHIAGGIVLAILRPDAELEHLAQRFDVAVAFDEAAGTLMDRRRGYCFGWNEFAKRTPAEWDDWLNGSLRRLRW